MYIYIYVCVFVYVDIVYYEIHCELQNHCPLLWILCYFYDFMPVAAIEPLNFENCFELHCETGVGPCSVDLPGKIKGLQGGGSSAKMASGECQVTFLSFSIFSKKYIQLTRL